MTDLRISAGDLMTDAVRVRDCKTLIRGSIPAVASNVWSICRQVDRAGFVQATSYILVI